MAKLITPYKGIWPRIHPNAYVDISARVIGDVAIEDGVSIWPMAVLRADSASIRVGRGSAILDLALLEAPEGHPVVIEEEALISHGAVIHGAQVRSGALVGIGSILLDGSVVSSGSVIAAGSVVSPGTKVPPHALVMGTPGRVVRETTEEERRSIIDQVNRLCAKSREYLTP